MRGRFWVLDSLKIEGPEGGYYKWQKGGIGGHVAKEVAVGGVLEDVTEMGGSVRDVGRAPPLHAHFLYLDRMILIS